jgi:ABC-2 type transport system ATP-binding protein
LHVRLLDPEERPAAQRVMEGELGSVTLEPDAARLSSQCADPERGARAISELASAGIGIADFSLGQPSLDEVFLALTGRPVEDDETQTITEAEAA